MCFSYKKEDKVAQAKNEERADDTCSVEREVTQND